MTKDIPADRVEAIKKILEKNTQVVTEYYGADNIKVVQEYFDAENTTVEICALFPKTNELRYYPELDYPDEPEPISDEELERQIGLALLGVCVNVGSNPLRNFDGLIEEAKKEILQLIARAGYKR